MKQLTRNTRQKDAVTRAFSTAGRPLSVPEVLEIGRHFCKTLGQRTVYRLLGTLVREGQLVPVEYPGQPLRYEPVLREHRPHFVCLGCSKIYRMPSDLPAIDYKAPEGFRITGEEVVFYGECPECARKVRRVSEGAGAKG